MRTIWTFLDEAGGAATNVTSQKFLASFRIADMRAAPVNTMPF
jgi:hypothetical protein